MKNPFGKAEPSVKENEAMEDSLASTKLALRFLYQEALRNNHFAMAAILQETLDCCDRINIH
ncbi:MAG TPA: hypothetical protein VL625_03535 [Patescibacteria group bacterium]|nr:hypothetical protein [Patescibacteria group bacterium]